MLLRVHPYASAGLLPKPPGLNLWGKKHLDEGLDTAKRFLHVTAGALVLEVQGDDEVRGEGQSSSREGGPWAVFVVFFGCFV